MNTAEVRGPSPATSALLAGNPSLPGSVMAVARYRLPEPAGVCDLDDPKQLLALGLRPSEVVTRDYNRSRAWARRIYDEGGWTGVRWWSYYDSKWSSAGLWGISRLTAGEITPLTLSDPALVEASRAIVRPISLRSVGLSAEINKIQVDTTGPVGLQRS